MADWGNSGVSAVSLTGKQALFLHVPEPCLCGCSLRTKTVLHSPIPCPLQPPAQPLGCSLACSQGGSSHLLRWLTSSLNSPIAPQKPRLRPSPSCCLGTGEEPPCNLMHKLVPMSMWSKRFIDPLSKSLPEESLQTYIHNEGSLMISLMKDDKSFLPLLSESIFSQLWSFSWVYWKHGKSLF